MSRRCSVYSCETNRRRKRKVDSDATPVRLHDFPRSMLHASAWSQFCCWPARRPNTVRDAICSRHFRPQDYLVSANGTLSDRLEPGAVPTQNAPRDFCVDTLEFEGVRKLYDAVLSRDIGEDVRPKQEPPSEEMSAEELLETFCSGQHPWTTEELCLLIGKLRQKLVVAFAQLREVHRELVTKQSELSRLKGKSDGGGSGSRDSDTGGSSGIDYASGEGSGVSRRLLTLREEDAYLDSVLPVQLSCLFYPHDYTSALREVVALRVETLMLRERLLRTALAERRARLATIRLESEQLSLHSRLRRTFTDGQVSLLINDKRDRVWWSRDDLLRALELRDMCGDRGFVYLRDALGFPLPRALGRACGRFPETKAAYQQQQAREIAQKNNAKLMEKTGLAAGDGRQMWWELDWVPPVGRHEQVGEEENLSRPETEAVPGWPAGCASETSHHLPAGTTPADVPIKPAAPRKLGRPRGARKANKRALLSSWTADDETECKPPIRKCWVTPKAEPVERWMSGDESSDKKLTVTPPDVRWI